MKYSYPPELAAVIANGGYAVIPTDTIYGIVCSAVNESAVEGLYRIKHRTNSKPFIVLLSDIEQLDAFGIPRERYTDIFNKYWPGPYSIVVPCKDERLQYLHRGTNSIAFRLPANETLRMLIRQTGPIAAPSANPEEQPPATTIDEAKGYFGDAVACYVDGGIVHGAPSTIIAIGEDGAMTTLR